MPLAVNEQSEEVKALAVEWPMLEALIAGTAEMRKASTAFLPQWPAETPEAYRARLSVATLFPAYRRTVNVMSGKPFSKTVTLDAPARIAEWAEDIDLQGVSLHSFAAEMFQEVIGFGLAGILVEYPRAEPAAGRTVAQVERAGLRPYWVRVRHDQILGWKAGLVAGRMQLTQLRLLESFEEPEGPYGVAVKPQVRVLEPGGWEVWREAGKSGEWVLADSGTTTLAEVPFVPLYGHRVAYMQGKAPLLDLAYLNVKHWQSQSDQDTIIHVARVPILTARDVGEEFELKVGASAAVNLGSGENAELKYVEHTGGAIEAGETSLLKLRDQMIETGAELLVRRQSGQVSATEAGNDAEANKSDLQRIAENFEDALDQALWLTAKYVGMDDGGTVELFDDYGAATLSDASAQLISALQQGGVISKETTISELKRRGVLAETVDASEEADKVSSEGPALGMIGEDDGFGQRPPA